MNNFHGKTLSWDRSGAILELALHREPLNEIGSEMLADLEQFTAMLTSSAEPPAAIILHSKLSGGFSAGADLRELFSRSEDLAVSERVAAVRSFLERIHQVMNALDASPCITIAAVHGVCFGGGFELALACDLIVADRTARFCFPELRLGLIPGFGGIPRLKRDLGNAVVRDLLFTGRSINALKAQAVGLVSQVAAEGEALRLARITAEQVAKFDLTAAGVCKRFVKPVPEEALRREIDLFCDLFRRPVVQEALRKFVENTDPLPYLP